MRRVVSRPMLIGVVLALVLVASSVSANPGKAFPDVIPLPDGFWPEGIATGHGTDFYVGSLVDGRVLKGDLRTGQHTELVAGTMGTMAVGLAFDRRANTLFVAGGFLGTARVYDASSGDLLEEYELAAPGTDPFGAPVTFINDVIVTRDAAYFTDSWTSTLYRVALGPAGRLTQDVEGLPLGGEFEHDQTEIPHNANGIEATPNGAQLIVVNTATGNLYNVDPETGDAMRIDLGEDSLLFGDGILLEGRTLYVVQNFLDQIAVVELDTTFTTGTVTRVIEHDDFRIPATVAAHGSTLYVVNARFDIDPAPDVEYEAVKVSKR